MTRSISRRTVLRVGASGIVAATALPGTRAFAQETHEVQMLNQDPDNPRNRQVFVPRIIRVQPGDTVTWLPTDRGHNSAIIEGMVPEGGETWEGRINEEVSVTLNTPGFYGYQCTPHASVGMVGLVIVEGEGMMDNLEAAQDVRQRGRAARAWDEIWEEVAAMDLPA